MGRIDANVYTKARLSNSAFAVWFSTILSSVATAQLPAVPEGFNIELVAEGLPASIKQMVVAPAGFGAFGGQIFIADLGTSGNLFDGQILRVDPNSGQVTTFAQVDGNPGFLTFGKGGMFGTNLYVNSNQNPAAPDDGMVSIVAPDGTVSVFGSPTPTIGGFLFGGAGIAFSLEGPFGVNLYSGCSGGASGDAVTRLPTSGGNSAEVFHVFGPIANPTAMEFGPGANGFGSDLYVGANLAGGTGIEGGIYVLDSSGTRTALVTESANPLFVTPIDMEFGPDGAFGTDLYVALLGGELVRVDGSGNSNTFVSSLAQAGGLAFANQEELFFSERQTGRLYRIVPASPIPTVSQWGLITMSMIILGAGALVLYRNRHNVTAA